MKISVVIPLYNKEQTIARAMNSVLDQTEQDFELIVVNDGSTDRSAAVVAEYLDDNRVCLIDQTNAGVSAARNRGVSEARTGLVAFLDADDEWLPEFLAAILELKTQFPAACVFGTRYVFQDERGQWHEPKCTPLFDKNYQGVIKNYLEVLRVGLPFNSSSFAISKPVFEDIGGFPQGVVYGEDVDTWIRLSLRFPIAYLNRTLAIYHGESENRACDRYASVIAEYFPAKNLTRLLNDGRVPANLKQSAVEYVAKYQLPLAAEYVYRRQPHRARELVRTCAGTRLYRTKWWQLYGITFVPDVILRSLIMLRNSARA